MADPAPGARHCSSCDRYFPNDERFVKCAICQRYTAIKSDANPMGESEAKGLLFEDYYERVFPAIRRKREEEERQRVQAEAEALLAAADLSELNPFSEPVQSD